MSGAGLIVIGGLPGTGKSTIAIPLARRICAAYLRIDTIEQALVDSSELPTPPQGAGHLVGCALAADQLRVGCPTVTECVNPLRMTRDAWRRAAGEHPIAEVELICSDADEHRRRVETRRSDVPGLVLPTWQQVRGRHYEPWDRDHLIIDTATTSVPDAIDRICDYLGPR